MRGEEEGRRNGELVPKLRPKLDDLTSAPSLLPPLLNPHHRRDLFVKIARFSPRSAAYFARRMTTPTTTRVVPPGLSPYTEQSTTILLPDDNTAFLNPIQQFNRDLSVAVISTWGKVWQEESEKEYELKKERKIAHEKEKKESGQRAAKKGKTGQSDGYLFEQRLRAFER